MTVVKYEGFMTTTDGKLFDNEKDAILHDIFLKLNKILNGDSDIDWNNVDSEEIISHMLSNAKEYMTLLNIFINIEA